MSYPTKAAWGTTLGLANNDCGAICAGHPDSYGATTTAADAAGNRQVEYNADPATKPDKLHIGRWSAKAKHPAR